MTAILHPAARTAIQTDVRNYVVKSLIGHARENLESRGIALEEASLSALDVFGIVAEFSSKLFLPENAGAVRTALWDDIVEAVEVCAMIEGFDFSQNETAIAIAEFHLAFGNFAAKLAKFMLSVQNNCHTLDFDTFIEIAQSGL